MSLAQQLLDVGYAKGCARLSYRQLKEVLASTASSVAVPQAPTSFTVSPQSDGSIIVTWPTPGSSVATTQVWISTDGGVTFTQSCNVAAPGVTCTIPNQGDGVVVIIKIRSCNTAGNCGPFTTTTTGCTIIIGGIGASDDFESYANASPLNGLNGGTGWCNSLAVQPYSDHTAYLGMLAQDDFESYANNATLLGLNGGTGAWNGAYGDNNVSVHINADSPNQWPTNGSTTTIVAVASGGVPGYTYQWNKNGVALTNAGHYSGVTTATLTITGYTSADDASYTCTVTDTTARSTTSLACVTLVAATTGQLWASLVAQTNGGAWPSQNTVSAFDTFDAAVIAASIKSHLYWVNLIAPDSVIAALTPIYATVGFTNLNTHGNGGGSANVTTAGILCNNITYDTGVDCTTIPSFTSGNMGLSLYFSPGIVANDNYLSGYVSDQAGGRPALSLSPRSQFNGTYNSFNGLETGGIDMAGTFPNGFAGGFCMNSRTSTTSNLLYFASSTNAWAQINSGNGLNATGPNSRTMGFGGNRGTESGTFHNAPQRFSAYLIHDGFSSADGQALYNAVQACRVSLGGGFA